MTKALIFSAWKMVPDAIATLCSYEAERRMVAGEEDRRRLYEKGHSLLRLGQDAGGRLAGLSVMVWLMPSPTLASMVDPLKLALEKGRPLTEEELTEKVKLILRPLIKKVLPPGGSSLAGRPDESWHWALPMLLERDNEAFLDWCRPDGDGWAAVFEGEHSREKNSASFKAHLQRLLEAASGRIDFGRPPEDLEEVLCDLALAGPGTCALRALARLTPGALASSAGAAKPHLLTGAAEIASGFRTLFNAPEHVALLRRLTAAARSTGRSREASSGRSEVGQAARVKEGQGYRSKRDQLGGQTDHQEGRSKGTRAERAPGWGGSRRPYWLETLKYCLQGNLQAVLDEHVHMRAGPREAGAQTPAKDILEIGETIREVLSLKAVNINIDELRGKDGVFEVRSFSGRCRLALRFGSKIDDEKSVQADLVRQAFNSPFKPFILASTSVAQEGLDFHEWCHVVVHWNIPSNPVDLEQREGRVQRFKGHAVRKNVAGFYGLKGLSKMKQEKSSSAKSFKDGVDPWQALFELAAKEKGKGQNDLTPFWIFEKGPENKVERRIPQLPYSREIGRYDRLRKDLTFYRMALGQPRQEDLVASLEGNRRFSPEELRRWTICLSPPEKRGKSSKDRIKI
jgi:hypothetical protein